MTGWKFPSLLAGFSASHSINGSSEPFCIKCKGFFLFLFFSLKRESAGVLLYKVFSFRWVTRPRATCGTLPCNHLNSYLKWKKCRVENKYLLTFRVPISSIRAPTWPEKFPQKPVEISLRHINFSICFVKQWFFWPFSHEKRGENPLSMGSLLFASTKIIHLPPKSKLI